LWSVVQHKHHTKNQVVYGKPPVFRRLAGNRNLVANREAHGHEFLGCGWVHGYGLVELVMVGVALDRSTPDSFAAFETACRKLPFILDCHLVAGDFYYFLKIRAGDMADFNHLHGDQLIALPGVRQTRTFFVMKEVVDNAPLAF
jgi:DNA-binding Lrp family transcriptional regulator